MSALRRSVGVVYLVAGTLHFARPQMYEAIMPKALEPWSRELVYASGVTEAAGGLLAVNERTKRAGRWILLATLAGVYPANVQMALNPGRYRKFPPWALWGRLPLQFAMAWHVWRGTE